MGQMAYGQFHVAEAPSTLMQSLHLATGARLKTVIHDIPLGVLDQQDLIAQGINTRTLIPGAKQVDALGSCTANATTAALSFLLSKTNFTAAVRELALNTPRDITEYTVYSDVIAAEEAAIGFYHGCTDLTGTPDQEWPPTDCGSTGPYIVDYCKKLGLASGALVASGAQNIVSLLQRGPLLMGAPFLNAWEEPDPSGFVDGNGSAATLQDQINQGVAGGHETLCVAIEKLGLTRTGQVIPEQTVLRYRNSWSKSWGDNGDYRIHLSTYVALGSNCDFRLLQAA